MQNELPTISEQGTHHTGQKDDVLTGLSVKRKKMVSLTEQSHLRTSGRLDIKEWDIYQLSPENNRDG